MYRHRISVFALFLASMIWTTWASATETPKNPITRLTALEEATSDLATGIDEIISRNLPAGAIVMWSGSLDELPEGWALCDGENGTPDLSDRFVMGSDGEEEQGGEVDHGHVINPHQHDVNLPHHLHEIPGTEVQTEDAGEHDHEVGYSTGGLLVDEGGSALASVAAGEHSHNIFPEGIHHHQVKSPARLTGLGEGTTPTSIWESAANNEEHLPPYYTLAFIMKLPATAEPPAEPPTPSRNPVKRIDDLEEAVATLSSSLDASFPYTVPTQLIVMWSGSLDELPEGWALCDGTDGWPDLSEKFLMGAATLAEVGEEGGESEHTHIVDGVHQHDVAMPSHQHQVPAVTIGTEPAGQHTHDVRNAVSSERVDDEGLGDERHAATLGHTHSVSSAGEHTHDVTLPERTTGVAEEVITTTGFGESTVQSETILPPYYKLAFIVKLPPEAVPLERGVHGPPPSNPVERIEALENVVAELASALAAALPFFVPPEAIAVWSGPSDEFPEGWALCDGENGTPDLSNRFVMGTVSTIGETGGTETHEHAMGAHSHTAYFPHTHESTLALVGTFTHWLETSGHIHEAFLGSSDSFFADDIMDPFGISVAASFHGHFTFSYEDTEHEHDLVLGEGIAAANTDLLAETIQATSVMIPASHLPPYYRAAFVMKLQEELD